MQWFVEELLRFGAVHWCPIHPAPPEPGSRVGRRQSDADRQAAQAAHDAGKAVWGKHVRRTRPTRPPDPSPIAIRSTIQVNQCTPQMHGDTSVDPQLDVLQVRQVFRGTI